MSLTRYSEIPRTLDLFSAMFCHSFPIQFRIGCSTNFPSAQLKLLILWNAILLEFGIEAISAADLAVLNQHAACKKRFHERQFLYCKIGPQNGIVAGEGNMGWVYRKRTNYEG